MRRGKHAKTKAIKIQFMPYSKRKKKVHYKNIAFLLAVIIIIIACIKMPKNNEEQTQEAKRQEEIAQNKDNQNNAEEETAENQTIETANEQVQTIDNNVASLIEQIRTTNNLNENNFAFFFLNLDNNQYYYYNENKYFKAASTIKVPVAMIYYDKIANGELKKEDKLTYHQDDYEEGNGSTSARYNVGDGVPISFLLEQSIVNSDNTANNILINNLGYEEYRKQIAKYSQENLIEQFYDENIETPAYCLDVLQYLEQNSNKYAELIELMKKSSEGLYLKQNISQYEIAHKYGSYENYVHDYGIIYGKNTYLVGVFTQGVSEANQLIAIIAEEIIKEVE